MKNSMKTDICRRLSVKGGVLTGLVLVLVFVCGVLSVQGAANTIYEQNFETITAEAFAAEGWIIGDPGSHTIQNGALSVDWNASGRFVRYWEDLEAYTISFLWNPGDIANPNENCYKAALGIRLPSKYGASWDGLWLCEPDNSDGDKTSYLGLVGIYFYGFGNTFEVAIHHDDSERETGAGSVAYRFALPEGKSFHDGLNVKVKDAGDTITFYVDGTLLGSIALSESGASPQLKSPATFQETVYRKAVVSDAAGNAVLTVTDALVPPAGSFAFINRGNQFRIDDLLVAENETPAETAPDQTAAPETTPGAEPGNTETGDPTGSLLLGVLVLIGIAAGGVLLRRRSLRRKEM